MMDAASALQWAKIAFHLVAMLLLGGLTAMLPKLLPLALQALRSARTRALLELVGKAGLIAATAAAAAIRDYVEKARLPDSPGGAVITDEEKRAALEAGVRAGMGSLRASGLFTQLLELYGLAPPSGEATVAMYQAAQNAVENGVREKAVSQLSGHVDSMVRSVAKVAALLLMVLWGSSASAQVTGWTQSTMTGNGSFVQVSSGRGCGVKVTPTDANVSYVGVIAGSTASATSICNSTAAPGTCDAPWAYEPVTPSLVYVQSGNGIVVKVQIYTDCSTAMMRMSPNYGVGSAFQGATGTGVNKRVTYWTGAGTLGSDANLQWDTGPARLSVVGSATLSATNPLVLNTTTATDDQLQFNVPAGGAGRFTTTIQPAGDMTASTTVSVPVNTTTTLAGLAVAQTFTAAQTFNGVVNLGASSNITQSTNAVMQLLFNNGGNGVFFQNLGPGNTNIVLYDSSSAPQGQFGYYPGTTDFRFIAQGSSELRFIPGALGAIFTTATATDDQISILMPAGGAGRFTATIRPVGDITSNYNINLPVNTTTTLAGLAVAESFTALQTFTTGINIGSASQFLVDASGNASTTNSLSIGSTQTTVPLFLQKSQNADTQAQLTNLTSGTGAAATLVLKGAAAQGLLTEVDSANTVYGSGAQTRTLLATDTNASGLAFMAQKSTGTIDFFAGAATFTTPQMRLASTGNLTIGSTTSTSLLNVGSAAQFQVNSSGNPVLVNNVTTSFPASQGGANALLTNDGSGNLTWKQHSVAFSGLIFQAGAVNWPIYKTAGATTSQNLTCSVLSAGTGTFNVLLQDSNIATTYCTLTGANCAAGMPTATPPTGSCSTAIPSGTILTMRVTSNTCSTPSSMTVNCSAHLTGS